MAKRPPKITFKRTPKSDEYVVYRNRKGKIVKPRGGVYLVGEIRNRKTKKTVGYLNSKNKESGKPNAQRFTSIQRAILTTPKVPASPVDQLKRSLTWVMYSKKPLMDQIPSRIVSRVNQEIKMQDEILLAIEIEAKGPRVFRIRTDARYFDRPTNKKELSSMIVIDVLNQLKSEFIRMSPKQTANDKQSRRKLLRKIYCTLIFVGFS